VYRAIDHWTAGAQSPGAAMAKCGSENEGLELPMPEHFMFRPFVPERVSGSHESFYVPCRMQASSGLVRSWEFRPTPHGMQTITGVRKARTGAGEVPGAMNGVIVAGKILMDLIAVSHSEELGLQSNDSVSIFIPRPLSDFEAISWQALPAGVDTIYVQAMSEEKIMGPSVEYPILQTYVEEKILDLLQLGEDFAAEFLDTARGFSELWINDSVLPRRPWVHLPKFKQIDNLCKSHPPSGNTFSHRCLEEEYAGNSLTQPCDWTGRSLPTRDVKDFVFGFGSLIQTASRCSSDPNAVDAVPVRVSPGIGFARSWNFQHPTEQITALGLEKTEPGHGRAINGVVVPVLTKEGMEALDERELGYKRIEVTCDNLQPLGWPKLPKDARVWMYVPCGHESEHTPGVALDLASFIHPMLQSYVDVCILACLEYSEQFAIEFINTTSGWGGPWLNDRKLPRRPWVHQPSYKVIDELLNRTIPEEFKKRMLPTDFSIAHMKSQAASEDQNRE